MTSDEGLIDHTLVLFYWKDRKLFLFKNFANFVRIWGSKLKCQNEVPLDKWLRQCKKKIFLKIWSDHLMGFSLLTCLRQSHQFLSSVGNVDAKHVKRIKFGCDETPFSIMFFRRFVIEACKENSTRRLHKGYPVAIKSSKFFVIEVLCKTWTVRIYRNAVGGNCLISRYGRSVLRQVF